MAKFSITGGKSLHGEIHIRGAKNAALKMMAASLLTAEPVELQNVPDIKDIRTMIKILEHLGATIDFRDNTMNINCSGITLKNPDHDLVKHMRASIVIVGPLLARFGNISIPQPGGCLIGARPIDTHVNALRQLGVNIEQTNDKYNFSVKHLIGHTIILEEMSVTATENVLMAAVLAKGTTEIRLAASEPEIEDLAVMLNSMGAKIRGAGTSKITIEGVQKLHGVTHRILPDRIEAGTFAIAAAVSRGDVKISGIIPEHLDSILQKFQQANINFSVEHGDTLYVKPTTIFRPISFDTRPHPGFPTDLQAPMAVLLTQANGTSKIFETMYEGRLGYVTELMKMGANIKTIDAHTIIVTGPTPLYGRSITSFDIRAGATLIIAALIAQGPSIIDRVELVDRGYEKIDERLRSLGADINRIS
ncbi:MAG: UDP-N-acetylglucosamine 1-carboxyvinyltransferase [Patescibacteria group bacterium]